jgi:L-histidine N-alpha-methyltransferase
METTQTLTEIAEDVYAGLTASPRYIASKYFYDERGSRIFREIMNMPEYYLTNAEAEIFSLQRSEITRHFCDRCDSIDLVELGAGDGAKTRILLEYMYKGNMPFRYIPVDISEEANRQLTSNLRERFRGIRIDEKTGDYFDMIGQLSRQYTDRKVVMFLGSNLGNYTYTESQDFLNRLSSMMTTRDKLFLGLDLKKDPEIIRMAYDDAGGHTRDFNLNLLERFNRELAADFDTRYFRHTPVYDPSTGTAKSYLVSTRDQVVRFAAIEKEIHFRKWEAVFTEMSQKYDPDLISNLAESTGFEVEKNYYDSQQFFINTLWKKV